MKIAETDILLVPGRSEATQDHWQSRWARKMATAQWVKPAHWRTPDYEMRIETLHRAVLGATRPVVLVAHSLGVLSVAHLGARIVDTKVRGALLVAPPDLDDVDPLPRELKGYAPIPRDPLPFPSMLVASATDPACTVERAGDLANAWGSEVHDAGDAGRLDTASGHGPWPEGMLMFARFMQRLKP